MRLAWLSDLHLDHIGLVTNFVQNYIDENEQKKEIINFCNVLNTKNLDGLIISGDISNNLNLYYHLDLLSKNFKGIIYFVLGNHDYYSGSIERTWKNLPNFLKKHSNLVWLDNAGVTKLTDKTALVGNGLWTDAKSGNWSTSTVWLNDYELIEELLSSPYHTDRLLQRLEHYSEKLSNALIDNINKAFTGKQHVIAVTHVSPYLECSMGPDNKPSDRNWAPHFVCTTAGEKINLLMKKYKHKSLTIYCGHNHFPCEKQVADNIMVHGAFAQYGTLRVQKIIDVE